MGYSTSRGVVLRNIKQLEQLHETKASLVFKTPEPSNLAYKLREAIHAAGHHPEFKDLAKLKDMYSFKVRRGEVLALYEPIDVEGVPISGTQPEPVKGRALPPESKTMPEALTLIDVLAMAMKFESDEEITFPNADLSEDDKVKLFEWTKDQEWQFIDHEDAGLTLTKKQIPEEVKWRPENVESGVE